MAHITLLISILLFTSIYFSKIVKRYRVLYIALYKCNKLLLLLFFRQGCLLLGLLFVKGNKGGKALYTQTILRSCLTIQALLEI